MLQTEMSLDMEFKSILDEVTNDLIKNRIREQNETTDDSASTEEDNKTAKESSATENKITVVDSIMGSGKTEAMLEMIRNDTEHKYLYVTPLCSEVERVIKSTNHRMKQPFYIDNRKLNGLHERLREGVDIVTTHSLFLLATPETVHLIKDGGYTLILDEVLDVLRNVNELVKELDCKTVKKADIQWLIYEHALSVDDSFNCAWTSSVVDDFQYSEIVRMCLDGTLRCIDDTLFCEFPVSVFDAFERIYILTYQFRGTVFDSYLKLHGLEYDLLSAKRTGENSFELCDYVDDLDIRKDISRLITVYEGVYNEIGKKPYALSVTNLTNMSRDRISGMRKAMRNVKNYFGAFSADLMLTTSMHNDFHLKLEQNGFKYIHKLSSEELALPEEELKKLRCFVPCNARATNDYSDRNTAMYMLNKYPPPEVAKYFNRLGVPIDEKVYATNELIQWIWRSRIRNGEPINLYLPSSRMRKLLYDWLGRNDVPENISEAV